MKTNESTNACPKCGAPVPPEAPQGLCPQCVFAQAAAPEVAPTATSQIPSLERLAVAFPQLQILELIGRGGMGFVFKARQPHLDRFVALKLLPDSLAHDPQFAERFNREGRVLARLNHPNIVSIFDFGQAGGFYYLMMEYVDGVNLRQAMQAGRFSPAEALTIVPKICEALQFAHEEGILHRDIKPENILLDAKGRVKIADFGIAKLVGEEHPDVSLTATGAALGTMHYMAPEQIEKPASVDHRADIYSLGVVFYELLTGELPLGRFGPPSAKTPVDSRVDDVVMRTLEKEREKRFQSAGEMGTTVEHLTEVGAGSFKAVPPKVPGAEPQRGPGGTMVINPSAVIPPVPAWSFKAISSAAVVGLSLLLPLLSFAVILLKSYQHEEAPALISFLSKLTTISLLSSIPAFIGTILGWMALSDVSVSGGRLRGAAFAVFAALAWPVLLLSGLTIWLVVAPIRNFSASVPFASFLLMLVPAGLVTFIIWAIYTTTRKATGQPAPQRRGVLKWIFLCLMLSALGLLVLAIPNSSWFPANFKTGPRTEVRYRVFEVESAMADNLVPVAQRQTGETGNWQMSDISPETLAALLKDRVLKKHVMVDRRRPVPAKSSRTIISTHKPGIKEAQQQVVVGWPIVSDSWSHGVHNRGSNDVAEVSGHGFFGVRRQGGVSQLNVQHVVTHKIGDRPAVDVNLAYEGQAPQVGALAFFIPFARKDDTTGYLIFAVEVNSVAAEAEPAQPAQEPLTTNTTPWIRFTFTAVELREVQGVRWLAIDYLDDVHGECQKSFPWENTIPGFTATTRTSEFRNDAKDSSPAVRHQRIEYRMPDSSPRDQLERLRENLEKALQRKSFRLELGEQQVPLTLFELPGVEGGSLKARIKVMPPLRISPEQPLVFGPVLERFLTELTAIDLHSSQTKAMPSSLTNRIGTGERDIEISDWLEREGMDFAFLGRRMFHGRMQYMGTLGYEAWNNFSPKQLDASLHPIGKVVPFRMEDQPEGNFTHGFKTRDGKRGLLKIIHTDNPDGVRIRYKLVQDNGTNVAPVSPEYRRAAAQLESLIDQEQKLLAEQLTDENPLVMNVRARIADARQKLRWLEQSATNSPAEAAEIRLRLAQEELTAAQKKANAGQLGPYDLAEAERRFAVAVAQGDSVAAARINLSFAEEALAVTKRRVEVGVLAPLELKLAESRLALAQAELKEALKTNSVPAKKVQTESTPLQANIPPPKIFEYRVTSRLLESMRERELKLLSEGATDENPSVVRVREQIKETDERKKALEATFPKLATMLPEPSKELTQAVTRVRFPERKQLLVRTTIWNRGVAEPGPQLTIDNSPDATSAQSVTLGSRLELLFEPEPNLDNKRPEFLLNVLLQRGTEQSSGSTRATMPSVLRDEAFALMDTSPRELLLASGSSTNVWLWQFWPTLPLTNAPSEATKKILDQVVTNRASLRARQEQPRPLSEIAWGIQAELSVRDLSAKLRAVMASVEYLRAVALLESALKREQILLAEQKTDEHPQVVYVRRQIAEARERIKLMEQAP